MRGRQDVMAQIGLLEDNSRIARLCATMLQHAGHQVTIFEHPKMCLDALLPSPFFLRSPSTSPTNTLLLDALILDLHLPEITGLDVLRALRAHPQTQSLPLIFCTAATAHEISYALRLAPNAHLIEKPFTYQELITTITTVLSSH